jgi:hypothetical protein
MKKVLIGLAIAATAFGASAQHTSNSMIRGHGWQGPQHHHHHARGNNWIIPALIGGAVVYAATRPDPVIVQQPPVIVQPSDIVYINGIAYRKQVMVVNGQYQEVLVRL